MSEPRLILASASPRRRELLSSLLGDFVVRPSTRFEPAEKPASVAPTSWALGLAYYKARSVAEQYPDCWVLGADTIVVCAGRLLGKARDADEAGQMLRRQAGRASEVITGLCLTRQTAIPAACPPAGERHFAAARTYVWMRQDPAEIERYVASGDWAGKAGAYGIQDVGDRLVERIEGSFSNVVGLPVEVLGRLFTRIFNPAP